ncbi:short-chain dehydrogenase [Marivirga lumbricoides]|uniref:Short-chain dehydrogenase n=1 Tax=Marivirga lumbricoides TaxID=1046115 RepID=A0ABQ1LJ19_9BACT|nr:short-chain dehydrogenase [Marivirga lumbricoides]
MKNLITKINTVGQEMVVVTGTSTGIGAATARQLGKRGFHVLAGVRTNMDADKIRDINIEPIMLDITNEVHIPALIERITSDKKQRPIRALINNAAIEINAPIEVLPLSEWRRQFEVNLIGQVAMIQALLPELFKSKGTVINISSIGGKVAMGGYGPYAATKFALEAVSDSLRREVEQLGVKVVVVEPGAVTSEMSKRVRSNAQRITNEMTKEQRSRYSKLMHAMVSQAESYIDKAVSAEKAGQIIANILNNKRPRTRYTIGSDAAMLSVLIKYLPDRLLDKLIARSMKPHLNAELF